MGRVYRLGTYFEQLQRSLVGSVQRGAYGSTLAGQKGPGVTTPYCNRLGAPKARNSRTRGKIRQEPTKPKTLPEIN